MATLAMNHDVPRIPTGKPFWRSGHRPTLLAAFLYFDVSFMVWVLLGPLAPEIAKTLALTPAEKARLSEILDRPDR